MYLFIDTETTGLPTRLSAPHTDLSAWPRIVSVSWAFYSAADSEHLYRYQIIRPAGFTIPNGATAVHGITTEQALREGLDLSVVLQQLSQDTRTNSPSLLIAHNLQFDRPVLLAEYLRSGTGQPFTSLPTHCTMATATSLVRSLASSTTPALTFAIAPNASSASRNWGYASSPNGGSASVSLFFTPAELQDLGPRISDLFVETLETFSPIISVVYSTAPSPQHWIFQGNPDKFELDTYPPRHSLQGPILVIGSPSAIPYSHSPSVVRVFCGTHPRHP